MKKRISNVLEANLILLLILMSYYIINRYTGFFVPCLFREITGYKCPGCGVTHLVFDLLNLKIADAFYENPLIFISLPFIIVYYIYRVYIYIYNKKDQILTKVPNYVWNILIVITILYGILRNIFKI